MGKKVVREHTLSKPENLWMLSHISALVHMNPVIVLIKKRTGRQVHTHGYSILI